MNRKVVIQISLVALVLIVGVGFFKFLSSMRKPPKRMTQKAVVPLLNAQIVKTESVQVVIPGFGTVQPKVEVSVIPQVAGKIVDCHEDFVDGGFFKADEPLVVIEPNDFELAVESADAVVKQAKVAYEKELAEQKVALQEWEQIHPGQEPNSPLVTRDLQVKFAMADYKSAQAKLNDAKLDLERTVIKMPFSGRVAEESVDIGQFITSGGQPIARVYSTEAVEIAIPLADTQLAWFDVPEGLSNDPNTFAKGAKVTVTADFAGGSHSWSGQVERTRGQIDPITRMVHVVVEVKDPFKLLNKRPPLVPGMFVQTEIQGKQINDIILIPRYAIRDSNKVWVEKDGLLKIVDVQVVRMDRKHAYIKDGLNDGDVVILSPLDVVTDGMKIRANVLNPLKPKDSGKTKEIEIK